MLTSLVFASGASVSGRFQASEHSAGHALVGLYVPATLAGTSLKISATPDGGTTWYTVRDIYNVDFSATLNGAAAHIVIPPGEWGIGFEDFRLETPGQTQSGAITVICSLMERS